MGEMVAAIGMGPVKVPSITAPATQTIKIQRITECGISLPQSVHFIAVDLAKEDLETVLARSERNRALESGGSRQQYPGTGVDLNLAVEEHLPASPTCRPSRCFDCRSGNDDSRPLLA